MTYGRFVGLKVSKLGLSVFRGVEPIDERQHIDSDPVYFHRYTCTVDTVAITSNDSREPGVNFYRITNDA